MAPTPRLPTGTGQAILVAAALLLLPCGGGTGARAQTSTAPSITIENPSDGAVVQSQSTISGSASDDQEVVSVDLTIQRSSDGDYWDGSGWVDTQTTVSAAFDSEDGSWTYDASSITGEDTYDVTAEATDQTGTTTTTPVTTYTIDTTAPSNPTIVRPSDSTFRRTSDTLTVTYEYTEANPDTTTLTFADGTGNSATFGIDDGGYGGGEKTVTLDLSGPDAGDLSTEGTYDLTVTTTDSAGNSGSETGADRLTIDNTAPSAPPNASATAVAGGDVEVAFDDVDDGGSGMDFYSVLRKADTTSTYGEVGTVPDDGSASYTFTDTTTTDGTTYNYVVTATDAVGNESDSSATATAAADGTAPAVSVNTPSDGAVVASQDSVTGSSSDDQQVDSVGLTIQRRSNGDYWDGSSWVATETSVAATADDGAFDSGSEDWGYDVSSITQEDTIDVTSTAADTAGNAQTASVTYAIDTTAPTVSGVTLKSDGAGTLAFSFEADEQLGTDTADLAVTVDGPTTGNDVYSFDRTDFVESGTGPYTYTLDSTQAYNDGDGTYTAAVDDALDPAGNDGADGSQTDTYTFDGTAPTITGDSLATDNAYVDVSFSEGAYTSSDGTGALTTGDLSLTFTQNGGSATDVTIDTVTTTRGTALSGGEDTVRVQISVVDGPAGGDETIEIQPADGSSIYYGAGNAMGAGETTGDLRLNDRRVPSNLALVRPPDSTFRQTSDTLSVTYEYAEEHPDTTRLTFADGTGNSATFGIDDSGYGGGEKTVTLDLSTPDSGDLSTERTYDLTVTTTDSAGNSSSTTGTDRLTIDNTAPSVTSVSAPPDSAYGIGTVLSFDATYDETVVVDTSSGTPALALDVDGTIVDAAYRSGSGTDVLTFEYTVQQGDSMLAVADSSIQLNGGIIADRAENDAGLDFSGSGPDLSGVTIDGVRPTITNLSLSNDGNDNLALRFDAEEQLGDAPTDVAVTVDGPTTTDVYRFDRTDFAATDNGDGTYTYDLTTTQPYNAGDGPYTAAVDDALDPAGNDGADGSQTDSYTLDTTAPADLSVDTPTSPAFRASTTANGVQDTLSVGYSYTEEDADTDSAVVQLASTPDTALYRFVDDAYAGDNTTRTRLLDLTAPDATVNSGLVDGQTYNIVVVAINSDGRTARTSRADLLTIDNTANAPTAVSATAVAGGDIEVAFDGIDDGGSGTDFYAVQRKQEGEDASAYAAVDTVSDDGSASYTVTDSTTTDGTTYDYAVTTTDAVGNASDRSTTATATADATPPTVQRFTADTPSGQTVAVTLETDEPLGNGDSLRVDLSGPETATLSGGDFTESAGSGSFTYEATYPGSSDGTYTATLTTARDTAGNDGAGGATAETVVDTSPPATLSLDGPASTVTRASDGTASGVEDTLAVTYSYSDLSPDTTTIRIENGSNSVAFGVDDDAYAADGSLRTVRLDLSEKGPLPDTAYDIRVAAADTVGQSSTTEQTGLLEIDDAAPSIGALSLTNDGANNLAFQFESPEPLASITATVDGPSSGTDLYVFDESDFSASGTGSYTYTLSATQAYDDGGGVYVARVDAAVDEVGNDGATTADSAAYELPTARDTTLATDEDTRISAGAPGVLGNDRPAASQLAVATVDGTDSLGTQRQLDSGALLTLSSDGSYDYNPNGAFEALDTGESGTDAFTYTAAGPEGGTSSPATVTLDIAGVNDTAVVETNASLVLPVPGTSQTITTSTLSASDPDDDATGLTFTVTAAPSNGTLRNTATSTTLGSGDTFTQADLENGHIAYRHDGSSTTSDEFTFELADDNGAGATGRTFNIFIDIDNQSPTATNDDTTTTENDVLTADQTSEGVLANDDDPNGDRLTVSSVGGSADNVGNPVSLSSGGTVTINTDGTYSFDPGGAYEDLAGGESASPSVTYTAADGKGGSDGSALTVTVTGVNDAPTLPTNDGLVVQAGESGTITASILSAADPDDDATGLTFTVTAAPANGTLRNTATSTTLGSGDTFTQADLENGHIAYRHDGSSTTSDEFTFDLIDDDGAGPTGQSFPITIQEGTPVAQADSFAATEDQTLSISDPASGVLANDSDPEGDDLTASLFRTPQHGSLSFSGDGTFEYTPDPDYNGADRFVYVAADPSGNRDTATVQLNVAPVNDPPTIAGDRAFSVSEGGTYVLTGGDLDGRDADDSPSDLTYSVGTAPSNGQILLNGSQTGTFTQADVGAGNVSYRHDGTDTRSDSVELTLSDGTATTSPTDVSVTVSTQNNAPTIATSSLSLDEGASATITRSLLEATDQESEPSGLTYSVTSGPSNGTILLNGSPTSSFTQADVNDGDLSYRHDGSETTADSVDVTVSDENGASASGTFSITVNPVNDAPRVATNEGIAVSEGGGTTITTASLDAADADDGPSALTFTVTSGPAHGRILVGGGRAASFTQADLENGRVAYRHDGSDTSSDDFAFDLTDDDGAGPAGQSFPITIQEGTPAARADTFAATENQTLSISDPANGVLANDRDPQEEDLTASLTQTPDDGDLRLDADGTFEYAPDAGYNGADRFAYAAEDPSGNRDTAAVQLNVKKVNAPPVATDDRYLTEEGQTLSVTDSTGGVLANDRDPDEEDRLAVAVTDSTDNGTIRLDATAGTFEYAPSGGFSGEDAFQYEVRDGEGGTDRATASLQVRPDQSRVTVERSFSNPTRQRSFRLVALPGGEGPPLASTLSGRRGDDWRAFREAGATDTSSFARTRCGAGTECTLGGGTGYWLITRNAWSVEDSVETVALRRDSTTSMPVYRIPLQDGWNAISNPLETDVPWSAVQAASGTDRALYRWDGRWRRASTFTSAAEGVAYYFRDDQLDTLAVPYPSPQPPASQAKTRAGAPTLTLHAVQDGDTLSTVRAGRRRGTAVGLDSLDRYGPPGYFGGASLRFRADGEDRRPALRADYRPPGPQGRAFDLRLRAAPDTVLTLVARSAAAFPGERVVLVNRAHGRTHDLRADASVSLAPQSETTRFRLLIGSAAFVEDAREALAPDETTLMPSYPNPFRRATTIEYALKERQEVRLAIYDVLGRRVQVLVDGPRRAGFHRLQWQGEGPDGRPVASGVYFARLVAGSTTQTERLVVVR